MTDSGSTSVTVFGKIPTYGDFVRINCNGPIWLRFDDWFQAAVAVLRRELGENFKPFLSASSPFQFLFSVKDAGGLITGVIHPSRDSHGRFSFLIVARSVSLEQGPNQLPSTLGAASHFYREASQLASTAVKGMLPKEDFTDLAQRLPALDYHVWNDDARIVHVPAVVRELRNLLGEIRQDQVGRFKLAFRLPVVSGRVENSVKRWVEECLSTVESVDDLNPCAFWVTGSDGRAQASVVLSVSEPSPNVLLSVVDHTSDLDEVMNFVEYPN